MKCVWEHNGNDTLLYSLDCVGAYTRGSSLASAMAKMSGEMAVYSLWSGQKAGYGPDIEIIQEKNSTLNIADADSDILFDSEKVPLSRKEYDELKALVLKSAKDFYDLYASIPDKSRSVLPRRQTFYGNVPRTAQEMYDHTKNVNAYYFAEIGIEADNEGTIYECRKRGFARLEQSSGFLDNAVVEGSYDELWSLRKVMRRFLWHDRIHAKAMYRMAVKPSVPWARKIRSAFLWIEPVPICLTTIAKPGLLHASRVLFHSSRLLLRCFSTAFRGLDIHLSR